MKILHTLCITSCLFTLTSCNRQSCSRIESIDSLSQAEQAFNDADNKTLIVFDVDETLVMPADAIWQEGRIWEVDAVKHFALPQNVKNVFNGIDPHDLNIVSDRMLNTEFKTVEPTTGSIVKSLQDRHLKVIALTNFGPGPFGHIPSLKEWRRSQLSANGIDFETSFPGLALTFSCLPATQSGYPEFYKGILFGANNPKGTVLGAFLDQLDYKPTKIIVIDDKEKYLTSIQQELAKRHISFQGFLYKGAEKNAAALDLGIVQYQLKRWKSCLEYVSDRQAHEYLNNQVVCA